MQVGVADTDYKIQSLSNSENVKASQTSSTAVFRNALNNLFISFPQIKNKFLREAAAEVLLCINTFDDSVV